MENGERPQAKPLTAGEYEEDLFSDFAIETDDSRPEDEFDLDDAEILEELTDEDIVEEGEDDEFMLFSEEAEPPVDDGDVFSEAKSPISTITLAELYVSQGFLKRALTIYRELLDGDPGNADLKKRLYELKMAIDEDAAHARRNLLAGEEEVRESGVATGAAGLSLPGEVPEAAATEERVIETLGKWLDNLKRRR